MEEKVNDNIILRCNICNKVYSSKSSLCNHNKKFHKTNSPILLPKMGGRLPNITPSVGERSPNVTTHEPLHKYSCILCNKILANRHSKWRHENKCNSKNDIDKQIKLEEIKLEEIKLEENTKLQILKEEIRLKENDIKLQILKEEKQILQLKLKLEKSQKVDNITLNKLNKKLKERNNLSIA